MDYPNLDCLVKVATVVSGFVTPFLFLGALAAAVIYWRQWDTMRKQSEASLLSGLLRRYAEPQMYDALRAVWLDPPEVFTEGNREKDLQRRMVHHFWNELAILWKRGIITKEVIFSVFDDVDVLERIHPLWKNILVSIIARNRKDLSEAEVHQLAQDWMAHSATAELYNEWLNRPNKEPWKMR